MAGARRTAILAADGSVFNAVARRMTSQFMACGALPELPEGAAARARRTRLSHFSRMRSLTSRSTSSAPGTLSDRALKSPTARLFATLTGVLALSTSGAVTVMGVCATVAGRIACPDWAAICMTQFVRPPLS